MNENEFYDYLVIIYLEHLSFVRPLPVTQRVGAEGSHSRSSITLGAGSFILAETPLRIFDRVVYPVLTECKSDAIISDGIVTVGADERIVDILSK